MKKRIILLRSMLTILFAFVIVVPCGFAQNLRGTWEVSYSGRISDWSGANGRLKEQTTFFIYHDDSVEPNQPVLTIIPADDSDDPFSGFVQENTFWFYKQNKHAEKLGGPNVGWEQITGKVSKDGNKLVGSGNGFDSNPEWGGRWSYTFRATKISERDSVP